MKAKMAIVAIASTASRMSWLLACEHGRHAASGRADEAAKGFNVGCAFDHEQHVDDDADEGHEQCCDDEHDDAHDEAAAAERYGEGGAPLKEAKCVADDLVAQLVVGLVEC